MTAQGRRGTYLCGFDVRTIGTCAGSRDDPAVAGLVRPYRLNESYTREMFDEIQAEEAPGHALVISQWKPELGPDFYSHPDTIPTIESIWRTFLPWFHTKTVHIGADEYDSALANDYTLFVNTISLFIGSSSQKDIRIWGTNEPSNTSTVSHNITIQHWEFFEDNPLTLINQNYHVPNSDDALLNITRIFAGNPAGGAWVPYVFDTNDATNNPPRDDPRWNDYGQNATTVSEAYYSWRDGLPALADKQWGGVLTRAQYDAIFGELHSIIPGQNLDRTIASKTAVILRYDFTTADGEAVKDASGNGYDGTCVGCSINNSTVSFSSPSSRLTTPLSSKGRNYTLSFSINASSRAPIGSSILSGPDSALVLGNGTLPSLTLISGNQAYVLNYTLPRDTWTNVALIGRGNATFLRAGDDPEMEFLAILGINGDSFEWQPIAVEAPLALIGGSGFVGSIAQFQLLGIPDR
ncbi:glycoside hydrolase superfamily [Mycena vitilis]|nr:glycoside hydrolase superfamily [Mycena vitilis]